VERDKVFQEREYIMRFLKEVWYAMMWYLADAWQWLLGAWRSLRNLTNWKAVGLGFLVQLVGSFVVYTAFLLIFGFNVPAIIRIVLNIISLIWLVNYFDRKYPRRVQS
jgi:hypothetical protein